MNQINNPGTTEHPPTHTPAWSLYSGKQRWLFLAVLFLISTSNVVDRQIINVLLEPIKQEFQVSDTMLGLMSGLAFAMFYVTLGIPIARWADRGNRKFIIGLGMTVWSLMTALCGMAQNFAQLAMARVGVGAGEAACVPPAQSLLADYFPPEKRSLALAIFFMSAAAGNVLGMIVGGQVAEAYGWRMTFVIFGLPGLLLVILSALVLKEPRNRSGFLAENAAGESLKQAISILRHKPSFLHSVAGMVLFYMMMYGVMAFMTSFAIRNHGLDLGKATTVLGGISLVAALIGNPLGGWLSDRLGKKDPAWIARIPGYGFLLCLPLFLVCWLSPNFTLVIIAMSLGMIVLMAASPPIFTCLHAVCGSKRRATAIAIAYFFANLLGVGLGPVIAGGLSDVFATSLGEAEGLRYALAAISVLYLPAAWFMLRAAKTLAADMED